uniref:Uncharacterized protein n=1 Tax=Triticum urartu TaxID=4572 RepID=A0A8R7K0X1_TRIUA
MAAHYLAKEVQRQQHLLAEISPALTASEMH